MFTLEEIKQAHSKVKSGSDFPKYVQDIHALGVVEYETWVKDGHTDYVGAAGYKTSSNPIYDHLTIALDSDKSGFEHSLKIHQQGETNYFTFCKQCAETGIERWFVSVQERTCSYYDRAGKVILIEKIPA